MVGVGRAVPEPPLRRGRRWVPASARTTEGALHGGGLFAVTTEGGECGWWEWDGRFPNRPYGEGEDGSPHPRGQRRVVGGSRTAPTGEGEDGSPHPRGQRRGEGICRRGTGFFNDGGGLFAGTTGGESGTGGSRTAPTGENPGAGFSPVFTEALTFPHQGRRWVPAFARTREWGGISWGRALGGNNGRGRVGRAVPEPPLRGRMMGHRGSPPSPVFTRAGSNLPPSRGKGFVGAERAIFIVMTCRRAGWVPAFARTTEGGAGV